MLNKIIFSISLLTTLLFTQCKKIEVVPDITGSPVFVVNASLGNGEVFNTTAGLDHYRMYTSYELGTDGVYTFIGEFKKEPGQTENLSSLRFEIRDVGANLPQLDIDSALSIQSPFRFFITDQSIEVNSVYTASFVAFTMNCPQNLPPESFLWNFGDNIIATGDTATVNFADANDRNIELTINYGNDMQFMMQQNMSFDSLIDDCGLAMSSALVQNGSFIQLTATGMGPPPYSYLWHTNETFSNIIFPVDSVGPYSVIVTDGNGCTATASGDIPDNPNDFCTSSISYTTSISLDTLPPSPQYSTVTIVYVDNDGNEFRSDGDEQSMDAFFAIQRIEDYARNENGEPTKKIDLDFSCELYSPSAPSLSIQSTGAVIAVAYPD